MEKMRIKSPLTDKREVRPLVEAGADEFFCGIEPKIWRRKFRDFSISQRGRRWNFTSFSKLEKAIAAAHMLKSKVHVTVNAFFYLKEQYECAVGIIRDVLSLGADGIIFADLGLFINAPAALLKGKDIIVGTDAVIFNHQASRFYKELGATRVVIPRAVTIREIRDMVTKEPSLEYEVFIINDLCFFVDGLCAYCKEASGSYTKKRDSSEKVHFFTSSRPQARGYGGGCRTPFRSRRISVSSGMKIGEVKDFHFWMKKHIQGCGACALYDFKRLGISSLKVLDRNLSTEAKVRATAFIKRSLDFLKDDTISKDGYIEKCKGSFKETFGVKCNMYDCYYPERKNGKSNTHKQS